VGLKLLPKQPIYCELCQVILNVGHVERKNLQMLGATFGCAVRQLSFTYLGLPLGTTKQTVLDLSSLDA
jgi:hypothetical protein